MATSAAVLELPDRQTSRPQLWTLSSRGKLSTVPSVSLSSELLIVGTTVPQSLVPGILTAKLWIDTTIFACFFPETKVGDRTGS